MPEYFATIDSKGVALEGRNQPSWTGSPPLESQAIEACFEVPVARRAIRDSLSSGKDHAHGGVALCARALVARAVQMTDARIRRRDVGVIVPGRAAAAVNNSLVATGGDLRSSDSGANPFPYENSEQTQ